MSNLILSVVNSYGTSLYFWKISPERCLVIVLYLWNRYFSIMVLAHENFLVKVTHLRGGICTFFAVATVFVGIETGVVGVAVNVDVMLVSASCKVLPNKNTNCNPNITFFIVVEILQQCQSKPINSKIVLQINKKFDTFHYCYISN